MVTLTNSLTVLDLVIAPSESLLRQLEIAVAILIILASVKTAYNGTVRGLMDNIQQIPQMKARDEQMAEKLDNLSDTQINHVQVTRANARALDATKEVSIDSDSVDRYLVDNGIPVSKLIVSDDKIRGTEYQLAQLLNEVSDSQKADAEDAADEMQDEQGEQ